MKLHQLTKNIYYSDYQPETDRPILGYIKLDKINIAIDAGHSKKQVQEFYQLLAENNLPLPNLTILTHWHWDHSFGLPFINGLSIACKKTNEHLKEFKEKVSYEQFLKLDQCIANEYYDIPMEIKLSDIEFENQLNINNEIIIKQVSSPHCDDACVIYHKKDKVLFIGDGSSGEFPTYIAQKERVELFRKELKQFDVDYYVGGHWPIDTKETIEERLDYDI